MHQSESTFCVLAVGLCCLLVSGATVSSATATVMVSVYWRSSTLVIPTTL